MENTIFIFHGTGGYPKENWFPWIKEQLEKLGCRVFVPQFPTPDNQTLKAWFEVFYRFKKEVDSNTILIGHSLGGSFLLRVLETLKKPIKASFLVATPIGIPPIVKWAGDKPFTIHPFKWPKIKKNCHNFFVYHSDNDPYVGLENGEQLAKKLGIKLTLKVGAGHFNSNAGYNKFPFLLEDIKKLLK